MMRRFGLASALLLLCSTAPAMTGTASDTTGLVVTAFYCSAGLLKPRISDYSLNLRFLRNNLNSDNFNYSSPVFLSRYSQGITKNLTLGERLEASTNLVSAGSTITT